MTTVTFTPVARTACLSLLLLLLAPSSVGAFTPAALPHATVTRLAPKLAPSSRHGGPAASTTTLQAFTSSPPSTDTNGLVLEREAPQCFFSCFTTDERITEDWQVHKFGGASLATAELYKTVGDLLISESQNGSNGSAVPTMAVVSARGGMTDLLVQVVDSALENVQAAETALQEAVESQISVLRELAPPAIAEPIEGRFRQDATDILSVVRSLRLLQSVPAVTMEVVTGFGEIWSAQTLAAYLQTQEKDHSMTSTWVDARDVLVVKSTSSGLGEKGAASTGGVTPLWTESADRLNQWWEDYQATTAETSGTSSSSSPVKTPIVVVTGFVAKTLEGVPTTLKRSGSDYSATIFAKLVAASRVTMWKNTNGVYTADPRAVPEAFPMASLTYDEAMELAYFGAQVLHPSAMMPCIDCQIPVYVRNIFNPSFEGTVIQGRSKTLREAMGDETIKNWRSKSGEIPIKGITSVDKTALVTLEGASIGGANIAERFMGAMADADITVLIITQASSESSITVAVPENQGQLALNALRDTFELELARSTIGSLSLAEGMSIVAIVGEGMASTSGVSSTFMSSLARANVNIRLIAQGSSERQIAVVVKGSDTSRALRAAHMAFTLSETVSSVIMLGTSGYVGTALSKQIESQKEAIAKDLGVAISVDVAASSTKMACCEDSRGLDMTCCADALASDEALDFDLDRVTDILQANVNPLRVVVDCTNSNEVADYYERWLSMGVSIISPGRVLGAGDLQRYRKVCEAQRESAANLYLDSSVGNALPIISTLHDLVDTGDSIKSIEGALSGTMAYALSSLSDDLPFSEVMRSAVSRDIPEKDIRVDLSGLDTAQKVVILARQAGLDVSIEDVEVESIVPDAMTNKDYSGDKHRKAILEDIATHMDGPMEERFKVAEAADGHLRYKFTIDLETGKCKCWLATVDNTDPVFRLKRDENLVAFKTRRYEKSPLIIKGAAAGPDLTAAGIFADLLRLTQAYSSNQG
jgi:aspartokinase/homoserine dehydrogenase 1